MNTRCAWVKPHDPIECAYHDNEWGVPVHDDTKLFEFLVLDAFQAGLTWNLILHKREGFRKAFADFDAQKVAAFSESDLEPLYNDAGIVRNKLKIKAAVTNAQAFLKVQAEFGSFDKYIWQFTDGITKVNAWTHRSQVPATSAESDAMSKDLKKRGFKFVGSTICYAFMQAAGMINDHTTDCFCYAKSIF